MGQVSLANDAVDAVDAVDAAARQDTTHVHASKK